MDEAAVADAIAARIGETIIGLASLLAVTVSDALPTVRVPAL